MEAKQAVPVGLLDSASGRGGLAGCLGGQLLARSLASGGLAGGLLRASHCKGCCLLARTLCAVEVVWRRVRTGAFVDQQLADSLRHDPCDEYR